MRQLALHEEHRKRGARFREAQGAEVVASYGDLAREASEARSAAVLTDRSHRGRLAVRGTDRVEFLHGQSTNDIGALRSGQGAYTAFLTGKGKMRGDAVVYAFPDRLLLGVEGDALAAIRAHLESFVVMEDVRIADESEGSVELGVHGPGARAVLAAAGVEVPADLAEHNWAGARFQDAEVTVAREMPTGEDGCELLVPPALAPALFAALAERAALAGFDALEALRVEAGIPRFGQDMDGETIPIEAGLFHAISYTKGCFTGQEVIARLKNYGHVNRNLVGIALDGETAVGTGASVLHAGKRVGAVTSSAVSPTLGHPIALAMVRREAAAPGSEVEVEDAAARRKGTVAELPFVRRK